MLRVPVDKLHTRLSCMHWRGEPASQNDKYPPAKSAKEKNSRPAAIKTYFADNLALNSFPKLNSSY